MIQIPIPLINYLLKHLLCPMINKKPFYFTLIQVNS